MDRAYKFRADGFPLCPRCGEDELYSYVMMRWRALEEPRPTMAAVRAGDFRCYRCNWYGRSE